MPRLSESVTTTADQAACWALLADFGHIDRFNPALRNSVSLDGPARGAGAVRQCNLKDGRNYLRERVVDWQEGRSYTIDIYESSMPLARCLTTLRLAPAGHGTRIAMELDYLPAYGIAGRVLDVLILRRMLRRNMRMVIDGLDRVARTGSLVAA